METLKKRTGYAWTSGVDDLLDAAADQGMDEEEQEQLIAKLSQEDESTTAFYRGIFIGMPVLGLFYLLVVAFVAPQSGSADIATSAGFHVLLLLSLLVSLATAYTIPVPGRQSGTLEPVFEAFRWLTPYRDVIRTGLGYSVAVNALLCIVICFILASRDAPGQQSFVSSGFAAIVVLLISIVVAVAKHELLPVDIQSLQRLKYDYKGA